MAKPKDKKEGKKLRGLQKRMVKKHEDGGPVIWSSMFMDLRLLKDDLCVDFPLYPGLRDHIFTKKKVFTSHLMFLHKKCCVFQSFLGSDIRLSSSCMLT